MHQSAQSAPVESGKRRPWLGFLFLSLAAFPVYLIASNWRDTIVSKRLDASGVKVNAAVVSAVAHSGSGQRRGRGASGGTASVTYAFDFAGRHFVDTDEVQTSPIDASARWRQVEVTVLPSDPDKHRVEPGHTSRTWEGTIVGSLLCLLFALIFGMLGVGSFFPPAAKRAPVPPPAEFFVRAEAFFDDPAPRRVRRRGSNVAWTALFTLLILFPPAYAAGQWRTYLAHRNPADSIWPWNWTTMMSCVGQGIPYFAVAVPMYFVRVARIRRCARLARRGCTTIGVVDWKLRVARDKARRKKVVIKIDGTSIGDLPGKEDWVTYHYSVDGKALTGESADGRAVLWRSHAIPPAVYLPTGREVTVVYDPQNPEDSLLLPYLRYYFVLDRPGLGTSWVEKR